MASITPPQVIVEQPFKIDFNLARRRYDLPERHRPRKANLERSIPAPRVLTTEELFTKYARCYHHKSHVRKLKGDGGDIVEKAMNEVLKDNTYIGFTFNEKEKSVYLLKCGDWNGIDDESIGCETRPIPKGLKNQRTSTKWEHHSLYIKTYK